MTICKFCNRKILNPTFSEFKAKSHIVKQCRQVILFNKKQDYIFKNKKNINPLNKA